MLDTCMGDTAAAGGVFIGLGLSGVRGMVVVGVAAAATTAAAGGGATKQRKRILYKAARGL